MVGDPLSLGDGIEAALIGPDGKVKNRVQAESGVRSTRAKLLEDRAGRPRVRPVRHEYVHSTCRTSTRIGRGIAETLAVDPTFYSTLYCYHCACWFPVNELTWVADSEPVGT